MKKLLMGPSGGTAAPMSAFMKFFVEATSGSAQIDLVPQMWRRMVGITNRELIRATPELVKGWDKIGGSPIIPSCKNTNVFELELKSGGSLNLSRFVKEFCQGYEGIVAIGGGGTTKQSARLHKDEGLNLIVPVATMDNDVSHFDTVLGYDTARTSAGYAINACVNDALTMQRPTAIILMGYECGRLGVGSVDFAREKLGCKVDMLHIPETEVAIEDVARKINKEYHGGAFTIAISEGVCKAETVTNEGQHKKFSTADYMKKLSALTGIEFKVLTPDYVQRSGIPTQKDVDLAKKFAIRAAGLIEDGTWNYVIGMKNGSVEILPLEKTVELINEQKNSIAEWYSTKEMSLDRVKDILIR